MSQEINFYQVDETIVKGLAPLLIKVLEEKKKAVVFCKNPAQLKEIDDQLWSYGRNKFIPHVLSSDGKAFEMPRQPVVLTLTEENPNGADYLVFLGDLSENFVNKFERVFYFYDEFAAEEAKDLIKKFKPSNSFKRVEGKWVKG